MNRIAAISVLLAIGVVFTGCQSGGLRCRSCFQTGMPGEFSEMDNCGCGLGDCSSCGTIGCDTAPGSLGGCNQCGGVRGPLQHLQQLFRQAACGAGCGEVYWGEWTSDPPDCCDPCDSCGIFTGVRGGCAPRRGFGPMFRFLLGVRHGDRCGCDDCTIGEVEWGMPETMTEELQAVPPGVDPPGPNGDAAYQIRIPRRVVSNREPTQTILIDQRTVGTGVRGVTRR